LRIELQNGPLLRFPYESVGVKNGVSLNRAIFQIAGLNVQRYFEGRVSDRP